jgi:hypothetical protein
MVRVRVYAPFTSSSASWIFRIIDQSHLEGANGVYDETKPAAASARSPDGPLSRRPSLFTHVMPVIGPGLQVGDD